ncbi:type I pullulanase [Coprobacter sp.]
MKWPTILFFTLSLMLVYSCSRRQPSYANYSDYPVYTGEDLGVSVVDGKTNFVLWAPTAEKVQLQIYDNGESGYPEQNIAMTRDAKTGVFRASVPDELYGKYYTYRILKDKKWLPDTPGIWAKAVGVNGNRGAIIRMRDTDPEGWDKDLRPPLKNFTDIILYEMHYRDFSIDSTSGIKNRGKFLALTEKGTVNPEGLKTGIDHLKELGITHVHLLPSFDFGSIDETKLYENKYNWGYDPKNYNVPEGSYSTDPYTPETRIREMKKMVQALHENGIRVIMDVVYNHTYVTDGSNFNLTVPGYYYRHNPDGSYSDASYCGNETASEREMMRQYIIQSALYWIKEYHIDGFRFDLMGIHDLETMNILRDSLNRIDPTIFVYGEGWTAGPSPYPQELRAMKTNATQMPGIAVFNDDVRDAVKGSFKKDENRGFATGMSGLEESVKFGIVAATQHPQINYGKINYSTAPYALQPAQSINYVSSHDDLCLVDKLTVSTPENTPVEDLLRYDKLAQTIIFTSQGVPFMFNGEEVFRSKKLVHNSFESPDSINQINWMNKSVYYDLFDYYKSLIALRKNHPAFRMATTGAIQSGLRFVEHLPENVIAYTLNGKTAGDAWDEIFVAFNGNGIPCKISVPGGGWTIVCRDGKIDESGLGKISETEMIIPKSSAIILKR